MELKAKEETFTCHFEESFEAGTEAKIVVEFAGVIGDKMAGFYRSSYEDEKSGGKKWMSVTQFEATDARRAFPCWDEPSKKATFDISITAAKHLTVLSNMDQVESVAHDGVVEHKFRRTPLVSTYLIAWALGEFDSIETVNKHGVKVRVFATEGQADKGKFALDVAARTLDFFTEYFGIAYPLPKMDMLAVHDFSAGAMENWGLVTYRSIYLLFDEESSSLKTKQNVAYVVGHELAHQWFGNLVTMEWWSDLWLNEGFATWVGWLAADHLFPEWDIWTEFIQDDCQSGLNLDCMRSSHAIEVPVRDPSEITQIFDAISYSKGASVIRMLVDYLGEGTFQRGLRAYLQKHKYGNARTEDLWSSLSEASGKGISEIMHHWTKSMGYPLVEAKVSSCAGHVCNVKLCQSRYLSSGKAKAEEDTVTWSIPISVQHHEEVRKELMSGREHSLTIPSDAPFFKLNSGQAGFYRVKYPEEWLERLGVAVSQGKLSASDRNGLVSDVFALSTSGDIPIVTCFKLLSHFRAEENYIVWGEIAGRLGSILSIWYEEAEEVQAHLRRFIRDLSSEAAVRVGFEFPKGESDVKKLLRPILIGLAGATGNEKIIAEARERFQRFIAAVRKGDEAAQSSAIHPNLRAIVYNIVMREGGSGDTFEALLEVFKKMKVPDQKLATLGALTASKDVSLVQRGLELSLKEEPIRPQDHIYLLGGAGRNPKGRRLCWEFVQKHWAMFHGRYGNGGLALLSRVVSASTGGFAAEKDAAAVEGFFEKLDTSAIDRAVSQSVEGIRMHAAWLARNRESVSQFLIELYHST